MNHENSFLRNKFLSALDLLSQLETLKNDVELPISFPSGYHLQDVKESLKQSFVTKKQQLK